MIESVYELIIVIIVGIALIVIGILNTQGKISMIHSYHRKRVAPENIIPFGRIVGTGSIIIGAGCVLSGVFGGISYFTNVNFLNVLALIAIIVSLIIGTVFFVVGMVKYNKGIF